jgi:hypothetical protein
LGEEILIGGNTAYDAKAAALAVVMREWTSASLFQDRCRNLEKGIKEPALGLIRLARKTKSDTKGTVLDDGLRDALFGGEGNDWFFSFAKDDLQDRGPDDR